MKIDSAIIILKDGPIQASLEELSDLTNCCVRTPAKPLPWYLKLSLRLAGLRLPSEDRS